MYYNLYDHLSLVLLKCKMLSLPKDNLFDYVLILL